MAGFSRFITKFYPKAELTACDINQDGVDFCKKEFRAHPVYSKHNLQAKHYSQA